MRLEIYRRADGVVIAMLYGIAPSPLVAAQGQGMEHIGACRVPPETLSAAAFAALGQHGWAALAGEEAQVLWAAAWARRGRTDTELGESLIETAIAEACRTRVAARG